MGQQIIRQPDGLYALFSSVVDNYVMFDATPEEIVEYFTELERERIERSVGLKIAALSVGRKPYHQFTLSWEEACQKALEVHGEPVSLEGMRAEYAAEMEKNPPRKIGVDGLGFEIRGKCTACSREVYWTVGVPGRQPEFTPEKYRTLYKKMMEHKIYCTAHDHLWGKKEEEKTEDVGNKKAE